MSRDFNGAANFLNRGSDGTPNVGGTAMTMACWFRADAVAGHLCGRYGSTNPARQSRLWISGSVLVGVISDSSAQDTVSGATTLVTGQWYHGCVVKNGTGAGALKVFLNGVQDGSITSNRTIQSIGAVGGSQFRVAINAASSDSFDGRIAEVAQWNVALTDGEILALGKGVPPMMIRRTALQIYCPLYGISSPEVDLSGQALPLTLQGSPTKADHAPVGRLLLPQHTPKVTVLG